MCEIIGRGQFGYVRKAMISWDEGGKMVCAAKSVSSLSVDQTCSLLYEATLQAQLSHANIISVLGIILDRFESLNAITYKLLYLSFPLSFSY